MPRRPVLTVSIIFLSAITGARAAEGPPAALPVRGIHLSAPGPDGVESFVRLIRDGLAKEGVNTLILEINTSFEFSSRPELSSAGGLRKEDLGRIASASKESGIALIPQLNCLGHQSWSGRTGSLLTQHPELDETHGKYPGNKGIYCRSYCPLHPGVHEIIFALIDELAAACDAEAFHVGMDEVFILADRDCPRCAGKDPAELFAGEVRTLHDHLGKIGCRMWMWGDRFLDGKATKIGEWEASVNGTAAAIDKVPKDIVICDWHYEKAHETPRYFAEKGFDVVACPWKDASVALGQLALIRGLRAGADAKAESHALGVVQTTWSGPGSFVKAFDANDPAAKGGAADTARCFRHLFEAIRNGR